MIRESKKKGVSEEGQPDASQHQRDAERHHDVTGIPTRSKLTCPRTNHTAHTERKKPVHCGMKQHDWLRIRLSSAEITVGQLRVSESQAFPPAGLFSSRFNLFVQGATKMKPDADKHAADDAFNDRPPCP